MTDHTTNRRDLMKTAATGVAAGALGVLGGRKVRAAAAAGTTKGTIIKVAGYDYDRVRAIMDGQVGVEGADVNFHVGANQEIPAPGAEGPSKGVRFPV